MTQHEGCEFLCIHKDKVIEVLKSMPEDGALCDLAELFKVFGDSTRIKILYALKQAELCVCDLSSLLSMSQTAISHQLRVLKLSKLIKSRKDGKNVFYSLDDSHVDDILSLGEEHISEV